MPSHRERSPNRSIAGRRYAHDGARLRRCGMMLVWTRSAEAMPPASPRQEPMRRIADSGYLSGSVGPKASPDANSVVCHEGCEDPAVRAERESVHGRWPGGAVSRVEEQDFAALLRRKYMDESTGAAADQSPPVRGEYERGYGGFMSGEDCRAAGITGVVSWRAEKPPCNPRRPSLDGQSA